MKNLYLFLFLLVATSSFAQLSVRPSGSTDNYMYVQGTVLYVGDDIALTENTDAGVSNIYLRDEAQLVQGRTGTSQNAGTGNISLYQEGTTNMYAYNYWASPVSAASGTGNSTFSVTSLGVPLTTLESNDVTPISGYNSSASTGTVNLATYWIYKFLSPDGSQAPQWISVGNQQAIGAGEGFTMKGVNGTDNTSINGVANNSGSGQRFDFRGRPNDGLISIPIVDYFQYYLVGNPYPSALNLSYFLLENSGSGSVPTNCTGGATISRRNATTGVAYFWSSDPTVQSHYTVDYVGGYATFSPNNTCIGSGEYTPPVYYNYNNAGEPIDGTGNQQTATTAENRRYSPIGQGFYVLSPGSTSGALQNIQFKNTHRSYVEEGVANESVFERNSNNNSIQNNSSTLPKLRLNVAFDDKYTRQLLLGFDDDATSGADTARDAYNIDNLSSDAGFLINNSNYVIDIRPYEVTDRMPLYLKLSEQKDIAIRVNNFENFSTNEVYIYDKETENYYSVKDNTFYITLPAGNYSERFELTFIDEDEDNLSIGNDIAESFDIFQNNSSQLLEVANPMGVDLKSVTVYDMTGKQVIQKANLGTNDRYTFSTANLAASVYVVKILTQDNVVSTKKISVLNRG